MKRYGYHRTSTREQHLGRGIKEITAYCEQNNLWLEKIFIDQQTGKNFNRPRYQVLKEDVLTFPETPDKWKMMSTTTGTFINAGHYKVLLSAEKMDVLAFDALDIQ